MKKIPASFELTQEDIEEAIKLWINQEHDDGEYENEYVVTFKIEKKDAWPKDDTTVITASVIKNS
jgi:hypothetical protein